MNLLLLFVADVLVIVSTSNENSCDGGFDVYFVLDRSTSVNRFNFQNQTVQFVDNIIQHLISPKLRVSLVVFSNDAELILPLTGDRTLITAGVNQLKNINPGGATYLLSSLEKVQNQINEKGAETASVVIILTDGNLYDEQQSVQKTNDLRIVGTTVFAIGVEGYKLTQLQNLANKPSTDYVFTAPNYKALQIVSAKIISKACIEISSVEPKINCIGISRDIVIQGRGLLKTYDRSKIKCGFQFNSTYTYISSGYDVTNYRLKCNFPAIYTPMSGINVKLSLNGKTYISSNQNMKVVKCEKKKKNAGLIVIVLLVIILLALLVTWWFWYLLPCVRSPKPKKLPLLPATGDEDLPSPTKKKWDTVDTSFYGGGGVGGMKPVRVQWGDKGATEAGNKLTKTPDAKVIAMSSSSEEASNLERSDKKTRASLPTRIRRFYATSSER